MATLTDVSPVLLCSDVDRSVAFYRDGLGFDCILYGEPPDFVIAARDGVSVFLALTNQTERIVPNWHVVEKMWNVYVRVDDADALYAEIQDRGTAIDYSIYDAPHGMREFGVTDPDGHDIAFGHRL